MSITFNRQTTGMDNAGTNLVDRARDLARSGKTAEEALPELNRLAVSDGTAGVEERTFLSSLENNWQGFTNSANASMDPNTMSFNVADRTIVNDRAGNKIVLLFSDHPSPAKQVQGDAATASSNLTNLIPENRRQDWQAVNKHNIGEVRGFVNSLHLNPQQRGQFIEQYLTANYNHPGLDIQWNGASLQNGIDAVPADASGRKYLDCEAYLNVVNELGGNARTYALDADHSGTRNHQVGVSREGNNAVVWSNNERKVIPNPGNRTDEQLIRAAYPEFSNVVRDQNGPMRIGTEVLTVGENIPGSTDTEVEAIIDGTTARGVQTRGGSMYSVRISVNEQTGEIRSRPDFKQHDTLQDSDGNTITMNGPRTGTITSADGTHTAPVNVTVTDLPNGGWNWAWTPVPTH